MRVTRHVQVLILLLGSIQATVQWSTGALSLEKMLTLLGQTITQIFAK